MIRLAARRVLRPDGSLRPGVVVCDGPRVVTIGEPEPDEVLPDTTLAPGLVDLQVNGFADFDVGDGTAADLAALGTLLGRRGTTAWCPTLTSRPLPDYEAWLTSHPAPAPGEIGLHLEGPFLAVPGAHRADVLRPPDLGWLAALPARIRLVTLAPELPGAGEAIALLAAAGRLVSLGHSDADFATAAAGAAAGARMVTHTFNAMGPLHHRRPGLAGAALTDDRLTPAVIGDGVHTHPAVLKLVLTLGPAVLVSDSVATGRHPDRPGRFAPAPAPGAAPLPDGSPASTARLPDGTLAGGARPPDGTLAGSVITLADAVRIAVHEAGVPLGVALTAATSTPADLIGYDGGRLQPGGRADLVAFDPGLALSRVWIDGQVLPPG